MHEVFGKSMKISTHFLVEMPRLDPVYFCQVDVDHYATSSNEVDTFDCLWGVHYIHTMRPPILFPWGNQTPLYREWSNRCMKSGQGSSLFAKERSRHMATIRSRDTRPELLVRFILRRIGIRHRLEITGLPCRPDLILPETKIALFVHGCFWHQHPGCRLSKKPLSRLDYWLPKLARNRIRDARQRRQLSAMGWSSLVVWECELRDPQSVSQRIILHVEKRAKR